MPVMMLPDGRVRLDLGKTILDVRPSELAKIRDEVSCAAGMLKRCVVYRHPIGPLGALISPWDGNWRISLIDNCGCVSAVMHCNWEEAEAIAKGLGYERAGTLDDVGEDWLS